MSMTTFSHYYIAFSDCVCRLKTTLTFVKALPHVTISSTISSTMVFNVAKIASARASSTISLTKSLRVAGP